MIILSNYDEKLLLTAELSGSHAQYVHLT